MCLLASTVGALQLSDDPCGAHARGRCAEDTRRLHLHTIMIFHGRVSSDELWELQGRISCFLHNNNNTVSRFLYLSALYAMAKAIGPLRPYKDAGDAAGT